MLRADVLEACAARRFPIWPITTIDEGIALLTGMPAGERGADDAYPERQRKSRAGRAAEAICQSPQGSQRSPLGKRKRMSAGGQENRHRLIVELCHGATDARTLRAVAEMAALLQLDLHGLFVEDEALLGLAELPFVRELRLPPTREWQPIEAGRIAAELQRSAADARCLLREIAGSLGVPEAFEVRRGDPAEVIAAVAMTTDVVAVAAPAAPVGRIAHGAARVQVAAHHATSSLLPAGLTPQHGPVAAVLTNAQDPALAMAARDAANTHGRLLLLLPAGDVAMADAMLEHTAVLGVPRTHVTTRNPDGTSVEDVLRALGHTRERLVVLARGASTAADVGAAWRIAANRGVPVLLVERGT